MPKEVIAPSDVLPSITFSQAIKMGNTIFVSGQTAIDAEGRIVGGGDVARQTEETFENIKRILEAAGASLSDVVKITTFMVDVSQRPEMTEVRNRYFPVDPPASTVVGTSELAIEGLLLEVDAIAIVE